MKKQFTKLVTFLVVLVFLMVAFAGCAEKGKKAEEEMEAEVIQKVDVSEEEYVAVHALSSYPMFVDNDHVALKQFAEEYGVKVTIAGPEEWDIDAQAKTIEEVAARKPAGMLVYGFSPALKNAIDNAVDAGIPVVCVDADVPDSKRFAHVGTDWYEVGMIHAREMARLTGGKGKIAAIMVVGMDIFDNLCLPGFKDELSKYPDMEFIGVFDDKASVEESARITTDLLSAYPDLAGISGFDGVSPGIGAAIQESDRAGEIKVTAQDVDPPQLSYIEKGIFHVLVGQKRKLFSYYGAKLLYDYLHSPIDICANDEGTGIKPIPEKINTGVFLITKENVKTFKGE